MKKLFVVLFLLIAGFVHAQDSGFKPLGKASVKVFTNYHSIFSDSEVHNSFEVQRAYFGYSYKMSENFSGKLTLDVGNPSLGKLEMTAYLKNAFFQYKKEKLTLKFGLIGLKQFKLQEKQWAGRYLYKSFQDEYKFGSSADLAFFADYKLHKNISVDLTVANGEGYKKINNADSIFKYSAGITFSYSKFNFRFYYDYMGDEIAQQTVSLYAAYENNNLKLAAEYNKQLNHYNAENEDFGGYSAYASYKLEKFRLFGRFDYLSSETISGEAEAWNYAKDGQALICGLEFLPVKGLKISPNYQAWFPANGSAAVHAAYLSCEIKF